MSQITAIATTGGMGSVGTLTGDVGAAATPTASNINILGGSNIGTVTPGGGSDVTINLDDTVSISGSMTAGTGLTTTTGNADILTGNVNIGTATPGNSYDLSIEKTVAGAIGISVQNPSVNAAASSTLQLIVEPATDDTYVAYVVNGANTWSSGIDNSDSDKWKLTTGTSPSAGTEAISVATTGMVTMANDASISTLTITGNINMPATNAAGTAGIITWGGMRFLSSNGSTGYGPTNTFLGLNSGNTTTTGALNTGIGSYALSGITTGAHNAALGMDAGFYITSGSYNTLVGNNAGSYINAGSNNVAVGVEAGINVGNGNNNTFIGCFTGAGLGGSESYNVYLGQSVYGVLGESQTMRLGASDPGLNPITDTFIAGIYNTAIGATAGVVLIDDTHQLGSSNGSNGQVLVGGGTGPVWANITSTDTSVTITNGANTIDLSVAPSSSFTWNVETGASVNMAVNNGYIANRSAATLAALLPATAAVGDVVRVTGIDNATGWRITQNAGQTIHLGTSATTTGVAGYLESTAIRDSVELVCVIANTTWNALSIVGNITVA